MCMAEAQHGVSPILVRIRVHIFFFCVTSTANCNFVAFLQIVEAELFGYMRVFPIFPINLKIPWTQCLLGRNRSGFVFVFCVPGLCHPRSSQPWAYETNALHSYNEPFMNYVTLMPSNDLFELDVSLSLINAFPTFLLRKRPNVVTNDKNQSHVVSKSLFDRRLRESTSVTSLLCWIRLVWILMVLCGSFCVTSVWCSCSRQKTFWCSMSAGTGTIWCVWYVCRVF